MKKLLIISSVVLLSLVMPMATIANKEPLVTIKKYTIPELRTIVNESINSHKMQKHAVLVHTVVRAESSYNPRAKDKKAPCFGLFQLLIDTAAVYDSTITTAEDLYNPQKNANAGVAHLKYLLETYPKLKYVEIVQMYNLGEPKFMRGVRNPVYIALYKNRLADEMEFRKAHGK